MPSPRPWPLEQDPPPSGPPQVRGIDAVGNAGDPATINFQTDTQPPNVTRIQYPAATQEHTVRIDFQLDDGALGSGVANVSCRLRATFVSGLGGRGQKGTACGAHPRSGVPRGRRGGQRLAARPLATLLALPRRHTYPAAMPIEPPPRAAGPGCRPAEPLCHAAPCSEPGEGGGQRPAQRTPTPPLPLPSRTQPAKPGVAAAAGERQRQQQQA
jgi:hypothetical protein